VTAKGQPDVATRIALGKIREYVPKIKFYCLVDYNPGGMQILSTYSFGSAQRAHDNLFLAVQEIQHIGILSHQVHKDDWLELNEDDNTLIEGILKHDYLEKTMAGMSIRLCVQEMTSTQKKTDIDFLIKRNKLDIFVKDAIKEKRYAYMIKL
jgi:meiotic recombination protein SPO11